MLSKAELSLPGACVYASEPKDKHGVIKKQLLKGRTGQEGRTVKAWDRADTRPGSSDILAVYPGV